VFTRVILGLIPYLILTVYFGTDPSYTSFSFKNPHIHLGFLNHIQFNLVTIQVPVLYVGFCNNSIYRVVNPNLVKTSN